MPDGSTRAQLRVFGLLLNRGYAAHAHTNPLARDGGTLAAVFYGDYDLAALHQRGVRFVTAQVHSDGDQLAQLVATAAEGRLRVGIDSVYPLHEAADAHRRAEQGHLQSKIIIEP